MTDAKAAVLAFALSFGLFIGYGVRLVLGFRAAVQSPPPPPPPPPPPSAPTRPGPRVSEGPERPAAAPAASIQAEVKPRPTVRAS
jgi:hypothetical protein